MLHMACDLGIILWVKIVLVEHSRKSRHHRRGNNQDDNKKVELHLASEGGNEVVLLLLLLAKKGADVKAKDNSRRTTLWQIAL